MSWTNDGLKKKFGTEKTTVQPLGEFKSPGSRRWLEIKFAFGDLPTSAAGTTVISGLNALPVGCSVEAVEIYTSVDTASSGGTATFSVGTIDQDYTSNGVSNSLVDAATITEMNTGGTNIAGWVGTLINGTALTTAKLLTWTVGTQNFTAGKGVVRIYYSVI